MKNIKLFKTTILLILGCLVFSACERELSDDATIATYPKNGEVFIDVFSTGLEYLPFEFSFFAAFTVDEETVQSGTAAMRFDVPSPGDPDGEYAGAIFPDYGGRDLSDFDALTFWAKASKSAMINEIGFGIDFEENLNQVTLNNLELTTAWKQYMIAIPNPARLTQERGLFWYAESPENGEGYTFWIDELEFASTSAFSDPRPAIADGFDIEMTALVGTAITITGLTQTFMQDNGVDQTTSIASSYLDFDSSDTSVVKITEDGVVEAVGSGTAIVAATLNGIAADGTVTVTVDGEFTIAPEPTIDASQVVSIFSDTYTNEPVDYFNGYWAPYQTTLGGEIEIANQNLLEYTDLNFVGIQFAVDVPTIDVSEMTHFYFNMQALENINQGDFLRVEINDAGADNTLGTADDSSGSINIAGAEFASGDWITINRPLSEFSGLTTTGNLAQIIFVTDATIEEVFIDNIFFYFDPNFVDPGGDEPTTDAPTPSQNAANVISLFSDSYTDEAGTNFFADWGQATVVSQQPINGNPTMVYAGLNYQGIELSQNIDVSAKSFLHLDYWTANSNDLNIYLISPGPNETPVSLAVPTSGWVSIDIPLSSFSSVVDLADIFQLKFDGNGDIYLDNLYFF